MNQNHIDFVWGKATAGCVRVCILQTYKIAMHEKQGSDQNPRHLWDLVLSRPQPGALERQRTPKMPSNDTEHSRRSGNKNVGWRQTAYNGLQVKVVKTHETSEGTSNLSVSIICSDCSSAGSWTWVRGLAQPCTLCLRSNLDGPSLAYAIHVPMHSELCLANTRRVDCDCDY